MQEIVASSPAAPILPPASAPPESPSPAEELAGLVAWGSVLFYYAEVGKNPSVTTYWDAYHYIATSLSVGYANIFPVTPAGKAIGAIVMMVGPALSARALDPATNESAPDTRTAVDAAVIDRLDAILAELQKLNQRP
ncbi:MAG: ion channel [Polyangiaceae bacterium]